MFQGMEYVYEVYKERSFSKAAANLFISQPSLSANENGSRKKLVIQSSTGAQNHWDLRNVDGIILMLWNTLCR